MKSYGIYKREGLSLYDFIAITILAVLLYATIATAKRWSGNLVPNSNISLSLSNLPVYAIYSLARASVAYIFSFIFTIFFGYWAAKNKIAEKIILPLLDIGQSIPVLGFLPGLVLGLMSIFPHSNFGIELACIIMIFTSQAWNMCFSFYSSLKTVPDTFHEMSALVGLSRLQKLFKIELPFAATGLAWNSLVSIAGGWFFLTVCEAFTLEGKNFRLPGLGSYMALAIEKGDRQAILFGILTMFILIVIVDVIIWRPIIAWTSKFTSLENSNQNDEIPFISLLLKESPIIQEIFSWIRELLSRLGFFQFWKRINKIRYTKLKPFRSDSKLKKIFILLLLFCMGIVLFSVLGKFYILITGLDKREAYLIVVGSFYTFLRVMAAVAFASLWTIPVGILIGLSPKATRFLQPIIQITASFPAPMIFPIVIAALHHFGIKMGIGACALMLVGVQWYMLFNVLAGSMGISNHLRDSFRLMRVSKKQTWIKLYLPSIFPSLVTGWITASGSAWNASIVAEYIQSDGQVLSTLGLGSLISNATAHANYDVLAASLAMMVIIVVAMNQLIWQPLLKIGETRFQMEQG